MNMLTINEISNAVKAIAPKYPIHSVKLFGSYAEGGAKTRSDVDVIIQPIRPFTLLDLVGFQQDLAERLEISVDVIEEESLVNSSLLIERTVELYGRTESSRLGAV
jgi:predicted nucleotidyltransferase